MEPRRKKALNLLRTARGQIDSVVRMLENDRYCVDVCKQLLAIPVLLTKANKLVLQSYINTCVIDAINTEERDEKIEEIFELIGRYSG
ncbi:MAG: metal-sensing transcriptional repressor [Spirochaetaceae bacterium]|nr:metal-sensing transcriptional repressor [Spirochaetaceae bacterium]